MGAPAKPFRMALGALIIKEKLGTSDRETVEQIKENPYLQYFIGLSEYSNDSPFEASMMVYFRERINMGFVKKINQKMVKDFQEKREETETEGNKKKEEKEVEETKNKGKLILDATAAPADITHPNDLKKQVEEYKNYTGYYPSSVHVDKIYRTRENRAWCKERGIRISGSPLGRKPKNISKESKKQAIDDEIFRNVIEGKFGQAKRRYSLNCIMSKLPSTSETSIAIIFLVINLSSLLRQVNCLFLSLFLPKYKLGLILASSIIKVDIKA